VAIGQVDIPEWKIAVCVEIARRRKVLALGQMLGFRPGQIGASLVPITVTTTFCVLTPPAWSSSCTV
jgi:hypothetical protein